MVFFVKISVLLFLLPFLLLLCSSHAKDGLPSVRVGDRKLLGLGNLFVKGFSKILGSGKHTEPIIPINPVIPKKPSFPSKPIIPINPVIPKKPSFPSKPIIPINPVIPKKPSFPSKPVTPNNPVVVYVKPPGLEEPEKLTAFALKKIGESVVGKLFGSDGKRGFRIGWKAGKRYNAVEDRCQKYQLYFNCTTLTTPLVLCKNPTLPISLPINCVVEIVEATDKIHRCTEECGVPPEAPCTFLDDVVTLENAIPIENVKSKCSVP